MSTSPFEFIVRDGPQAGQRITLPGGTFTIGSGERCAIRFPANLVRERHAEISRSGDALSISDLTGARLLWVDGKPTARAPLSAGAELRIGRQSLSLVLAGTPDVTVRQPTPLTRSGAGRQGPRPVLDEAAVAPTAASVASPTPSGRFSAGDLIDARYRVTSRLAAGGMGEVYKVEHLELGKQLAMKVMLPGLTADTEFVNRFKIEAVAASRIGHPNIIDISDFGQTREGRFFFVMEFLDGLTLSSIVHRGGAQPALRVAELGVQIARALAAAHALHIVHRDLKPDNVMVMQRPGNPDLAKVLDFGVARVQVDSESIGKTAAGIVVGTPQYMSPEQAKAIAVDARSDIYSLGLILHELLVGAPTFEGETAPIVMVKQVTEPPGPLPDTTPPELQDLVFFMLEKNPADRPQMMKEVVAELDRICAVLRAHPTDPPGEQPRVATPTRSSGRPLATPLAGSGEPPPSSVNPLLIGVLLGLVIVVVGGGAWLFTRPQQTQSIVVAEPEPIVPPPVAPPEPPRPAAPVAPLEVVMRVVSVPEGVEVFENGVMLGNTPLPLRRKPNSILELTLSLPGYQTAQRKLMVSAESSVVNVTLEKVKGASPKPKVPDIKALPPELDIKPAPF